VSPDRWRRLRDFGRVPPLMQRTLADDPRVALFVLAGATLAWVITGADDPAPLLGATLGLAILIAILNVVRRARHDRGRRSP
jgi:hypothetical protein